MRSVERLLLFLLSRLLGLLCLLRFLRHVTLRPSQKLARCKSTSTCIDAEYTTFAKFIVRASKKVNDRAHRDEGGGQSTFFVARLLRPLPSLSSALRTCLNSSNDAFSTRGNCKPSVSSLLTIAEPITTRANHL